MKFLHPIYDDQLAISPSVTFPAVDTGPIQYKGLSFSTLHTAFASKPLHRTVMVVPNVEGKLDVIGVIFQVSQSAPLRA
jgi:hypothetical protein